MKFILFAAASLAFCAAAFAGPTYPNGAAVGLVPPAGMQTVTGTLTQFINPTTRSNLLLDFRPLEEFESLSSGMTDEALGRAGIIVTRRETLTVNGIEGRLVVGSQANPRTPGRRVGKVLFVIPMNGQTVLVTGNVMPDDRTSTLDRVLASLPTLAVNPDIPAPMTAVIDPNLAPAVAAEAEPPPRAFNLTQMAGLALVPEMSGAVEATLMLAVPNDLGFKPIIRVTTNAPRTAELTFVGMADAQKEAFGADKVLVTGEDNVMFGDFRWAVLMSRVTTSDGVATVLDAWRKDDLGDIYVRCFAPDTAAEINLAPQFIDQACASVIAGIRRPEATVPVSAAPPAS
jgi:hypothetical protein